jgi:predicted aconitase
MTGSVKPSTIKAIMAAKPPGADAADWIAGELKRLQSVRERNSRINTKRQDAREVYETSMILIDGEMEEIRRGCPHYSTTHHPDPAGGGDSFRVCDHCGKEW